MSRTERQYRLLVGLYPRDVRCHATEMWAVIDRRRRLLASTSRPWPTVRLWAFILWDLVRTVPQTHMAAWRSRESVGAWRLQEVVRHWRQAIRSLGRSPGFSAIVIITLAVAIGGNTAIFSVVNSVLLRPLPYPEPDRIVRILTVRNGEVARTEGVSRPDFDDWVEQTSAFESAALYRYQGDAVTGGDAPVHVDGSPVSEGFFKVLGTAPTHGRFFLHDEHEARAHVVVLSHGLWQREFGSDPSVVGRSIRLDGTPYEVIGVGPERFTIGFPERGVVTHDLWVPLSEGPGERGRDVYWAIGRLRPGVTVEQAVTQLDAVSRRLSVAHPGTNQGLRAVVVPLHEWQARDVKRTLLFALASALLVLTIAIANVAGLMLGRGDDRRGEFGVRVSLGASRSDLITQLLTESIVLAGVGGVLGVGLAFMLTNRLGILFVGSGSFAGDVVYGREGVGFLLGRLRCERPAHGDRSRPPCDAGRVPPRVGAGSELDGEPTPDADEEPSRRGRGGRVGRIAHRRRSSDPEPLAADTGRPRYRYRRPDLSASARGITRRGAGLLRGDLSTSRGPAGGGRRRFCELQHADGSSHRRTGSGGPMIPHQIIRESSGSSVPAIWRWSGCP